MVKFNYWLFERNPTVDREKPQIEEIGWREILHTKAATATEIEKVILDTFQDHIAKRNDLVLLCGRDLLIEGHLSYVLWKKSLTSAPSVTTAVACR